VQTVEWDAKSARRQRHESTTVTNGIIEERKEDDTHPRNFESCKFFEIPGLADGERAVGVHTRLVN
jgi:hypothetical protein